MNSLSRGLCCLFLSFYTVGLLQRDKDFQRFASTYWHIGRGGEGARPPENDFLGAPNRESSILASLRSAMFLNNEDAPKNILPQHATASTYNS